MSKDDSLGKEDSSMIFFWGQRHVQGEGERDHPNFVPLLSMASCACFDSKVTDGKTPYQVS